MCNCSSIDIVSRVERFVAFGYSSYAARGCRPN